MSYKLASRFITHSLIRVLVGVMKENTVKRDHVWENKRKRSGEGIAPRGKAHPVFHGSYLHCPNHYGRVASAINRHTGWGQGPLLTVDVPTLEPQLLPKPFPIPVVVRGMNSLRDGGAQGHDSEKEVLCIPARNGRVDVEAGIKTTVASVGVAVVRRQGS